MTIVALDTETTGVAYWDRAFCVTEAWRETDELVSNYWEIDDPDFGIDSSGRTDYVFHNAKFDVQKLTLAGYRLPSWEHIHDTECMIHLINEQQPKALKRLARELLGLETDEAEALRTARRQLGLKKADGYDALPREILEKYARKDAEFTLLLYEYLWPQIESDEELLQLYQDDMELAGVLFDMEAAGLNVDREYVDRTAKSLATDILRLDVWLRDNCGTGSWTEKGSEFNYNSWQQLLEVLRSRGLKLDSTKKEVLAALDDEFCAKLLELRRLKKQYDYFKMIQNEIGDDGILHPYHKEWGTRGRRFSSGSEDDA